MGTFQCIDAAALSKKMCQIPIAVDLKYAGSENFLGRPVGGYSPDATNLCLLTPQPAQALCQVQNDLIEHHQYRLLVLDAYRPLRAVQDFTRWMHAPPSGPTELKRKMIHYPLVEKSQFSQLGYVASSVSNHCFGHTVDLTLVSVATGEELDMGSVFDYFDELSHPTAQASQIGEKAFENRKILITSMEKFGFQVVPTEYWHFEFKIREVDEPFDLPITTDLIGLGS